MTASGENSLMSSGNLSLFSLTLFSNGANFKPSWIYKGALFMLQNRSPRSDSRICRRAQPKQPKANEGTRWSQLALPSKTKRQANRLADGLHGCENKPVTLKILLPLTQDSHQATAGFFSLPLLQHRSIHQGQPQVFKPCHALTIAQPASSVGQCGSRTGSRSRFIDTGQTCCSLQWEVLRKDKHRIITEIIGFFLCAQSPVEATHTDIAGVSWG